MMLEDILADHAGHYIMNVEDILHGVSLFTPLNLLNAHGKKAFWSECDKQIEKFDKKCLSLQPMHRCHPVPSQLNRSRGGDGDNREHSAQHQMCREILPQDVYTDSQHGDNGAYRTATPQRNGQRHFRQQRGGRNQNLSHPSERQHTNFDQFRQ